ncbi:MAG TPA: EAL domain-containing protein [Ureibacillus sp.]|nr:EAL domain-containing protein [Ureibacillus sp.]
MNQDIENLKDKKEQLFQLFNRQKDNIIVVDKKGTITYANRNAAILFNVNVTDIINSPISKLINNYPPKNNNLYSAVKESGGMFWVDIQTQPLTIDSEHLEVLIITEETDSRVSNEKNEIDVKKIEFLDTLKNLRNGIFTMSKSEDGKFIYTMAIGKLLEELGLYDEALRNYSPFEVFPEEIATIKQVHYDRAFQGESAHYEIDLNGRRVFVEVIPIKNGNEVTQIVGTVLDISELRSTQKELQINIEQYELLLNSSQDYFVIFDEKAQVINMNPKTVDLFGFSNGEIPYGKFKDKLFGSYNDLTKGYFEEALKGNLQNFELDILNKDKKKMFLNITLIPVIIDNNIHGVYLIAKDITEQKKIQDMNAYLAHHDHLTKLPNRRWMAQKIKQVLQEVKDAKNGMFAVFLIDLDRFKSINDTLGHQMGDLLLEGIGKRILGMIDNNRLFASRMGGDEFMILCSGVTCEEEVITIAEKFLDQLTNPFYIEDFELLITASIGICLYPTSGMDEIDLMKKADIALYKAKDLGRNIYQVYEHSMSNRSYQSFILERDLRKAILNDEFIVHLQPRVNARTGETVSAEALIRWRHPELGLVSPSEFIPIAEETGLIIPIGKWMKRKVCEKLVEWRKVGIPLIPISVNISSQRFLQKSFSKDIRQLLEEYELEGKWLEIEITENSIMKKEENVLQTLHELKELGVKIYIDDFGTGYSSFNYLKTFNLDGVKIDRSFIQNISSESENASITKAMIEMAQHLKLEVIAEGVETKSELDYLLDQNCFQIQGFYFGRPCATNEFEKKFLNTKAI